MPDSLRLGLVGPAAPPAGGMAAQTAQLRDLLQCEGVNVEFLQTNLLYRPAWIARIPALRAVFRFLSYLLRAWQLAGRVDVIHLMSNSGWSWQLFSAPVIWLAWLRKTPVIVNYRGGEAQSYLEKSAGRVLPTLRRASCLVVPSEFLRQVFGRFGVQARVIPNIVNTELFHPGQREPGAEPIHIIVVRNLEAIYDVATAIRAFDRVHATLPDTRLSIAGSGPELEALQQLVTKLNLQAAVRFVGRLDRDAIPGFYRQADLFVNSSRVDNMPNSLLEAMASGVPIASTDAGGIPYMVEHGMTALLSPVGDERLLADNMLRLIEASELRKQLIDNGLKQARGFSWPSIKQQWLEVYSKLQHGDAVGVTS